MGPICCTATSVRNHHYWLRNNPSRAQFSATSRRKPEITQLAELRYTKKKLLSVTSCLCQSTDVLNIHSVPRSPLCFAQDSSQYTRLLWTVDSAIHHIPSKSTNNLNTNCLSINKILSALHRPSLPRHVHNANDNHAHHVVQRRSNKHFAYDELFVSINWLSE